MASEVSRPSGTPVLRASKQGVGGRPGSQPGRDSARNLLVPDLPPPALRVIVLPGSRQWALPGETFAHLSLFSRQSVWQTHQSTLLGKVVLT